MKYSMSDSQFMKVQKFKQKKFKEIESNINNKFKGKIKFKIKKLTLFEKILKFLGM